MRLLSLPIDRAYWFAPWRVIVSLLVAASIWGWVDVRRRGYPYPETPGEHKSDLTVYTGAGAAFFDGRPPYEVRNPRGWTYVYPPLLALAVAPLHFLPMQDQAMLWFCICLWMCWASYRECRRIVAAIARQSGRWSAVISQWFPWLGVIAFATALLPTLNCLQRGQVTIVILYFLLLGIRLAITGRSYWAQALGGIALAVPVVIKIVPALPVAFVLFIQLVSFARSRWRGEALARQVGTRFAMPAVGFGFGLVLFFLLLPASLIGWNANLRHLGTWSQLVLCSVGESTATPGFEKDTHSARNQCLGNAVYRLGNFAAYVLAGGPEDPLVDEPNPPPRLMDAPSVGTSLLLARVALLLALLLVGVALAGCRGTMTSQAAGFGLACTALLVVSPVARNHYFLLFTPAVLFVPLWLDHAGRRRAATVLAIAPGVLIALQYCLLPYVGRVGLLGIGTAAWLMAAMVLLVRACNASHHAPEMQLRPTIDVVKSLTHAA